MAYLIPGRIYLSLMVAALVWLQACQPRGDDDQGRHVFRYNEPGNISSLDPAYARNQANIWAVSQLYTPLVELDTLLNVKPLLAHSWQISDCGRSYTFFLRTDVFFHDNACFPGGEGRAVRASDMVYSLGRLVDPALNSPGAWVMNPVDRYPDQRLKIEALSDTVLEIHLREAFPPFLSLLAMAYCSAVPYEAIQVYGPEFRRQAVGSGPFRFAWWKEGVKLVLLKNEHYFEMDQGQRLPLIDAVSIRFITDRQTAFMEFIRGRLDFLNSIDASYKDELLTPDGRLNPRYEDRFRKISAPFLNTEYLGMLTNPDKLPASWPLLDRRVRQAINYGFDREKMMRFLRNNLGTPAHAGFVPPGMPGFTENQGGYHYDPAKARRLLAEAGYPGGQGLPVIQLQTNAAYLDIARFLQHELSLIGIALRIDQMPPANLREQMARGEAPFFRASWIADYPDAENYLALFLSSNHSPAGPNYTHFQSEEFDELYRKALSQPDDNIRHELYHKMNTLIIEEAPVVFLFYDQSVRFVPHYIKGMQSNPLNHLILKRVYMQP